MAGGFSAAPNSKTANPALAVAMEYERASKLARRGELVEAQAREVLKDIMKRADMGETLQTVSIKSHFDTWLASKRERKSEGTGERYGVAVAEFLKTLGNRASKNLTSLTAADVERFLDHRTAKGLAPETVNVDVKIIRGALNAARRQGLIPTNPAEAVELPEAVGMERGTFTPAEVKMLVDTAEGEWKLLIMLAYFTGARLSDCCRMQWEGVDLAGETLTYTQAKTGAKVTVPLHPDLLARLNKLAGTDKPEVFIMPHTGQFAARRTPWAFRNLQKHHAEGGRGFTDGEGQGQSDVFQAVRSTPCATASLPRWPIKTCRLNCG